jgi:hypothetical protein
MECFAFGIHLWISTHERLGADTHPGDFTEHHFPIPIYSFEETHEFFLFKFTFLCIFSHTLW